MSPLVFTLLTIIILMALFLPFTVHKVEEQLEAFLFILGVAAVSITGAWSGSLIEHALKEPVAISLAVLVMGLIFAKARLFVNRGISLLRAKTGLKTAIFVIVLVLALLSSVITAIIAALALCEAVAALKLNRKDLVRVTVMGCFAIGMGAVLTPLGEPLSTIVAGKLAGPPHNAGFWFLLKMLWPFIIPGVVAFAAAATVVDGGEGREIAFEADPPKQIFLRAGKVFLFVCALVLFGAGLTPLAKATVMKLPLWALYWANSISAVLDNATLAAAEIVPAMTTRQIEFLLVALVISGGLLIPGNIPNIICAAKFKIKSTEWAKAALPLGAGAMVLYFIVLSLLPGGN